MNTITGPREDRTNEAARAGIPMTAANVRQVLADLERAKNKHARGIAGMIARTPQSNLTDEARAVYQAYADGATLA